MTVAQRAQHNESSPAPRPVRLAVLRALFDRLHAESVRYCHWKSNEHLLASFTGATDVDVLFDRKAIIPLTRILGATGFKRFVVKPGRGYPGVEDYVGFDGDTGALTHLHVHYQLTLGEKFLKGHRLPWEERYLTSRVWDPEFDVYVADPHLELVVLLVRMVMKWRVRDSAKEALGSPYFSGGVLRELAWLKARVDAQRLVEVARDLVGPSAAALLPGLIEDSRPSVGQLRTFGGRITPSLDEYRLFDATEGARQMLGRELGVVWWKLRNWFLGAPTKSTRTLPQGGLTVAFLGADGAGKSTVTTMMAEWLAREIAVVTTYGGSGKGSASFPRRIMQRVGALRRRLIGSARPPVQRASDAPAGSSSSPPSLARLVWILALSRERRRRARAARRAKGLGMIVISDRFPQSQFPDGNDGPRLTRWRERGSWAARAAARHEDETFRLVDLSPPDLVVKLHVTPETASARKPETPAEQVRRGIEVIHGLRFRHATRVVDVDAEQPLAHVILQAKRAVWETI
jgi:thymidylate kinase